jgi:hypothetical protein
MLGLVNGRKGCTDVWVISVGQSAFRSGSLIVRFCESKGIGPVEIPPSGKTSYRPGRLRQLAIAIEVDWQVLLAGIAAGVFRVLPRRPLVGGGTRRDGLKSHLRLKYGRFEPSNPSVDVIDGICIHR